MLATPQWWLADVPGFCKRDLYREAIEQCRPGGLYCEFGVAGGNSLRQLRGLIPETTTIYAFDSFKGLQESWDGNAVGTFATDVRPDLPNVVVVEGMFEETLWEFVKRADIPKHISFMHIDCDLYSATMCIFEQFKDFIVPGTTAVFDELYGRPDYDAHEMRALTEFAQASNKQWKCLAVDRICRAAIQWTDA